MFQKTTKYLIYITILLIPAYLIKFSIFGIPTNALEIFILLTFIFSIIGNRNYSMRGLLSKEKYYIIAILLILSGLIISTLVNENYRTGFGIIKSWFIIPLILAWILYKVIKKKEDLESTLKWLYLGIFGVAVLGLTYYFQDNLTYDGRLKAFYLSPNHFAMYIAPAVFIGLYLIQAQYSRLKVQNQNSKLKKFFIGMIISFVIILISFYLTYSYAAWLAIILSLTITILIINKKIYKHAVLIGLIILLFLVISQWNTEKFDNLKSFTRSSSESRITIWKSAVKILNDNLIWGIGPGNFQDKYLEYQKYFPPYLEWAVPQPHNLYLAFWLEAGFLGIIGFVILIRRWFKDAVKITKSQMAGKDIAIVLTAIMLYILIHGLVDTTIWKNDLAVVFWIILLLEIINSKISQIYESSHPKN